MKPYCRCMLVLLATMLLGAGVAMGAAPELSDLLREAAAAPPAGLIDWLHASGEYQTRSVTDKAYVAARDRIVAKGELVVPELRDVLADGKGPWQERVMAGICLERIERADAIRELQSRAWITDPEFGYDPEWRLRAAQTEPAVKFMAKRCADAGLQYHLLQLCWKNTGETPVSLHNWDAWAASILEKTDSTDLIHVVRDRLQHHLRQGYSSSDWCFRFLQRKEDRESLPILFEVWLQHREELLSRTSAYQKNSSKFGRERVFYFADEGLQDLLSLATTKDAGWITRKLVLVKLGTKGERALADYRIRARKERATAE